jgi:hypothetical protein
MFRVFPHFATQCGARFGRKLLLVLFERLLHVDVVPRVLGRHVAKVLILSPQYRLGADNAQRPYQKTLATPMKSI